MRRFCVIFTGAALGLLCGGCPSTDGNSTNTNDNTSSSGDDNTYSDVCDIPGTICTVAGTGRAAFEGDGKQAIVSSLYFPLDVCFDQSDRALILDWNNLRLRRIDANGTLETLIGYGFEAFPVPGALAVETSLHHASDVELDAQGRMYFAGNHAPLIFRVNTDQRVEIIAGNGDFGTDGDEGPALSARMLMPFGVAVTPDGGFYFSDETAHTIRFVDAAGMIHRVAGTGVRGYSGDGGPGADATISAPSRLRLDAHGRLFFCDTGNHCIRMVDQQGRITTIAGTGSFGFTGDGGPAAQATLNAPYDLVFSPAGDLYVADSGNNAIRQDRYAGLHYDRRRGGGGGGTARYGETAVPIRARS